MTAVLSICPMELPLIDFSTGQKGCRMPKVLIVDDDADVREGIRDALESRGLSCWSVENGREALECLRAAEVDLILTDYSMPEMNGLELMHRLAGSTLDKIPVILLSAESAADLRHEAMRLGAYGFIQKPFSTPDLTELVLGALNRNGSRRDLPLAATQTRRKP